MLKGIDWQMLSFVSISLVQDYLTFIQYPKVYYWRVKQLNNEDHTKKSA